jgi:hypothetical protein
VESLSGTGVLTVPNVNQERKVKKNEPDGISPPNLGGREAGTENHFDLMHYSGLTPHRI